MAHPEGAPSTDDGAPSRIRIKEPGVRDTGSRKPLLASEALMEDLAPVEPSREAARKLVVGMGVVFAALGVPAYFGWLGATGGRQGAYAGFALGGLSVVTGLLPVTYRRRAVAMLVVGALALGLGSQGLGPVSGLRTDGPWAIARVLAACLLPAALLFRSRYRAFPGVRRLLGGALVLATPFVVRAVLGFAGGDPMLVQVGSGLALLALAASLTGFMGAETTGASTATAVAILASLTIDLALRMLAADSEPTIATAMAAGSVALGHAAAALLLTLGAFQQLAIRLGPAARAIDIHKPPVEPPRPPPSSPDWIAGGG